MRLFVALPLPDAATAPLAAIQARLPAGRLAGSDGFHLTLVFLGEHGMEAAGQADEALGDLRADAITLDLAEPRLFGSARAPVLALGATGGPALSDLQSRVVSKLRSAGFEIGRHRFRPHVTLARFRPGVDPGASVTALAGSRAGPFACRSFGLFQSTLSREGAIHEPLGLYPLGSAQQAPLPERAS